MVPCWYFFTGAKELILKLGWFSYTFAEITNEMSSGAEAAEYGSRFQTL